MRKYLLTFLAFISFVVAGAQESIRWMDIETAEKANKKEPRLFIVDVYTDWCGWCKKMDAGTFAHPEIVKYINEKYYAVKFNAESTDDITFKGITYSNPNKGQRRATHELAGMAAVQGRLSFPTIVYMDEKLDLIQQVPSYFDAKGLDPIIHYFAEGAYKNTSWEDFQKNFKSKIQ